MLSYSHQQLLKTMLDYELKNFILPELTVENRRAQHGTEDLTLYENVRSYIEKRIRDLA